MRYVALEKVLGDKINDIEDINARTIAANAEINRDRCELSCLT
jgi:hypothetical protein